MTRLFISHSTQDDGFVHALREALARFDEEAWIDSRELRGGDALWPEIQKAIESASAFLVVVSPDSFQSQWIGQELRHALEVQKRRAKPGLIRRFLLGQKADGKNPYPVIPLSLDGAKLGVLEQFFDAEVAYILVSTQAGGIEAALNAILTALGKRLPSDARPRVQARAEPIEELLLELSDLKLHEQEGKRRASAKARLIHEAAEPGKREVKSDQSWRLEAPLGPIEVDDLRWYLEQYAIWPGTMFQPRAKKIEENLKRWGQDLYRAAMPTEHVANVLQSWVRIGNDYGRRFSVHLDPTPEAGAPAKEAEQIREAANLLLALPWELLHDGQSFLFQGAKPVRVRRRLPNTRVLDIPIVSMPIRILLISARPEDESCGYIDHRISAIPLVDAMEALGGLVELHLLDPPTLPALRAELDRARRDNKPYQVVHFDGHGVYDRRVGLGGLCFEDPADAHKLTHRRHQTVYTSDIGPLLKDHRIPLVFLEACQSAQAEKASESVASELLKVGVASVVAMSHSVLVETARRFVRVFYAALARGARVGDAMLEGQRALKDDTLRGHIFGAGELRLEDWFVPVLFQEKDDPQLFRASPSPQTQADLQSDREARLGATPKAPATGFIGRSRELLALQRMLRDKPYALVRSQQI